MTLVITEETRSSMACMKQCLTRRLYSLAEENNKIDEVQAGFRNPSKVENIFTLQAMVQKYIFPAKAEGFITFM